MPSQLELAQESFPTRSSALTILARFDPLLMGGAGDQRRGGDVGLLGAALDDVVAGEGVGLVAGGGDRVLTSSQPEPTVGALPALAVPVTSALS